MRIMHKVLLSLAANRDQEKNLDEARQRLAQVLFSLTFSRELWTEPIGAKRPDPYLNQIARGETTLSVEQLQQWFKQTETDMGRTDQDRREGIVRIDLDLLQYDDKRFHLKDWERDYVKALL